MNYSNSQRAGVILNFTAVLFGGYNVALEWDKRLDPLYKGPNPSESELQDVFLLREAIDKSCELHDRESSQKQFAKYQLMKSFQDVIDQLFPEN